MVYFNSLTTMWRSSPFHGHHVGLLRSFLGLVVLARLQRSSSTTRNGMFEFESTEVEMKRDHHQPRCRSTNVSHGKLATTEMRLRVAGDNEHYVRTRRYLFVTFKESNRD